MMNKKDKKLRDKIVQHGRTEIKRHIKNGTYIELLKREHGLMDVNELISDKEFLRDMIHNIEESYKRELEKKKKESEEKGNSPNNILERMLDVIKGKEFSIIRKKGKLEGAY